MILILMGAVLFVVGLLMALKPMTYWTLGHMGRPDAQPPGELYLKIIRIMGLVVILLGVLLAGIRFWPVLSGQEVKVSGGENWELAFTEDAHMAQLTAVPEIANALPYEAVSDGENIYFLGWGMKDGRGTGVPGIYRMALEGDFAGQAELLASLDQTAGRYENLKYEEGCLTWLQQPLQDHSADSKLVGTAVYKLDLTAEAAEPGLLCMLTQNLDTYEYHRGNVFLLDGNIEGATLWKWDGSESEKLVKQTINGGCDPSAEDGWIAAVNKKLEGVIRINPETGKEMELKTSLKPRAVWTSERYTLMACSGGQAAVVKHDGRDTLQYVLQDVGDSGLLDMNNGRIWQLDGTMLTYYDMETLTFCQLALAAAPGSIGSLNVMEDGSVIFCDEETNEVYYGKVL